MRIRLLSVVILLLAGGALVLRAQEPATPPPAGQPQGAASGAADSRADEAAIRANAEKYVEAYNRRDSRTMAAMWSPDAVYMDPKSSLQIIGRDSIAEYFDGVLAGSEDAKLAIMIDTIDFVSPNVAIEKGGAVVAYANQPDEVSLYSAVHVKRDGVWFLDRVSEESSPPPPPSNFEHLSELDWMVGSWIDDVGDGVMIQTDCEWTKNRNFMTRSFAVVIRDQVDMSGMQFVGWDPAANQIRSWVFDSNGGFGEGTWTRKDDRWVIQSTGTLPDGGKATATNILTRIDDNMATWQSVNRSVDGELLPNVDEVPLMRRPTE